MLNQIPLFWCHLERLGPVFHLPRVNNFNSYILSNFLWCSIVSNMKLYQKLYETTLYHLVVWHIFIIIRLNFVLNVFIHKTIRHENWSAAIHPICIHLKFAVFNVTKNIFVADGITKKKTFASLHSSKFLQKIDQNVFCLINNSKHNNIHYDK